MPTTMAYLMTKTGRGSVCYHRVSNRMIPSKWDTSGWASKVSSILQVIAIIWADIWIILRILALSKLSFHNMYLRRIIPGGEFQFYVEYLVIFIKLCTKNMENFVTRDQC